MSYSDIEIMLSSDSKYEKLTVEIYCYGKFVALLNQDDGPENLKIEFPDKNVIEEMVLRQVDLSTFEKAIELAKNQIST